MKKISCIFFVLGIFISGINSQTWVEQTSGVTTQLTSVSAVDDNNVWVCGYSGVVLKTTNGGTNWLNASGSPIPASLNLHCIFAIDSINVFVAGSGTASFLFKTTDGGLNWVQVFTEQGGFINAVVFGNTFAGYIIGDPVPAGGRWSLWGTTTSGITWDSATFYLPAGSNTEAGWNNAFYFDISTGLLFGTNNTRMYKTINLVNWQTLTTVTQANSYAMWFNNSVSGMMGGTALLMTNNGGVTWSSPASALPGTANISGITGFSTNWWVTRQGTAVYFSSNNGTSWVTQYTAPAGNYRHMAKPRWPIYNSLYAVRTNGGISKATGLTGLEPVNNIVPKQFSLGQNYPNPFNPSTRFEFRIAKQGLVKVSVYDELGREVRNIVNEELKTGVYEISFDGSDLSTGVYYYKLVTNGFSETKKMVLVK